MSRTKSPRIQKHRKIRRAARGFKQARSKHVKVAKEALLHAGQYAYASRKLKRRDLRKLWTIRINAAVRPQELSYSKFIALLKKAHIDLDRKVLAETAVKDPETFKAIVEKAKGFTNPA